MDEFGFARQHDENEPLWTSADEERAFAKVRDLLIVLRERGEGLTIRPVQGMRSGGFGSDEHFGLDGWSVGWIDGNSGEDLAAAETLEEALDATRVLITSTYVSQD